MERPQAETVLDMFDTHAAYEMSTPSTFYFKSSVHTQLPIDLRFFCADFIAVMKTKAQQSVATAYNVVNFIVFLCWCGFKIFLYNKFKWVL